MLDSYSLVIKISKKYKKVLDGQLLEKGIPILAEDSDARFIYYAVEKLPKLGKELLRTDFETL